MNQVSVISEKGFNDEAFYNKTLFESENFKVIPSLGSLIEGWLLIVPKTHYISFGEINNKTKYDELDFLLKKISHIIKKEYSDFIVFEHGPVDFFTKVGCGVDYAHLHIVPIKIDLIEEMKTTLVQKLVWEKCQDISITYNYYHKSHPYLYFQDNFGSKFITTNDDIPSQLFRKVIAKSLGAEELYDWKQNKFYHNIELTINRLAKYI